MTRFGRTLVLLLLLAAPLSAQDTGVLSSKGTCEDGSPRLYLAVDGTSAADCSVGNSTYDVPCGCFNGVWGVLTGGGSGAPTTSDYLVKTADGGLSAERVVTDTGTVTWDWATAGQAKANVTFPDSASIIFDIGDDAGNDSTALTEVATIRDDYGAVAESAADKALIDFAKIPPYQQYDPMRPPSSCATCDEFTGGTTLTFSWGNQESCTATAERDGLTIYHPADATGITAYWFTGPDGASADWTFHVRMSVDLLGTYNLAAIMLLATGSQATPTLLYEVGEFYSASGVTVMARSRTSYTSAATAIGTDQYGYQSVYLRMGYVTSTKVLTFMHSLDGHLYNRIGTVTLAAHPTTSFGLALTSTSASSAPSAYYHFVRVRTDANQLDAGE